MSKPFAIEPKRSFKKRAMSNMSKVLLLFVEISMVSFMISKSFSKWAENAPILITYSWEISLTEGTTP